MDTSITCHVPHTSISSSCINPPSSHSREIPAGLHAVGEADICGQHSLDTLLPNTAQPEGWTQARLANGPHQAWQPCPAHPNTYQHDGHAVHGACKSCPTMAMLLLNQGRSAEQHQTQLARMLDVLQTRLSRIDLQLHMLLNPGTASHPTEMVHEVSELLDQQGAQCLLEADLQEQVAVLTQCLHVIGWHVTEQRAAAAGQSYV